MIASSSLKKLYSSIHTTFKGDRVIELTQFWRYWRFRCTAECTKCRGTCSPPPNFRAPPFALRRRRSEGPCSFEALPKWENQYQRWISISTGLVISDVPERVRKRDQRYRLNQKYKSNHTTLEWETYQRNCVAMVSVFVKYINERITPSGQQQRWRRGKFQKAIWGEIVRKNWKWDLNESGSCKHRESDHQPASW